MSKDPRPKTSEDGKISGLSLYGYPQCPFCQRVLRAARALGLEIPLRNTLSGGDHEKELQAACGRTTVPVLCIEGPGDETVWLPESADIVRYLEQRFDAND